jgi:hypothetical protein
MKAENSDSTHGGRPKFNYFVDGVKYEVDTSSTTGAQMKAKIPNFNASFQLLLEGKGGAPDKVIADADVVDVSHAPHLYTAPPATFGR